MLIPYQAVKHIDAHRVLVLAPHPDDEVFGCGGAIMRHIALHQPVHVIITTDGAHGVDAEERARHVQQRQQESRTAAAVLDYGTPTFWDYPDRALAYGEKLVNEIVDAIGKTQADLIYAPSVYEIHPDHRALGMAALEAARRCSNPVQLALYEIGQPIRPNLLLDISDLAERKMQAMHCFASQNAKQRYDLDIAALNRYRTYTLPTEVSAAEAYILTNSAELVGDPLKLYQSEHTRQHQTGLALDNADIPLVSVIIRSMDRPTLSDALDSVAVQTYSNIEIVLVNAKGPGHRVVGNWCGRFPLRMTDNADALSRSNAANLGLTTANGDYLIFLDDDDIFLPEHIATLVNALKTHPRYRGAYSGVRVDYYTADRLESTIDFNTPFDPSKLWGRNFIPIHAMLFERTLVTEGCVFDENLDILEDWDFWIQVAQRGAILHIDSVTAIYRNHGDSGMGSSLDQALLRQARARVFEKWKSRFSGEQLEDMIQYWEDLNQDGENKVALLNEQITGKTHAIDALQNRIDQLEHAQHASALLEQSLRNTVNDLNAKNSDLNATITALTQSSSWKITAPLRFISRLLRGQHREAWDSLRRRITPLDGIIFKQTRHTKQSGRIPTLPNRKAPLTDLTDLCEITPLTAPPNGRIAIHAHIYYADLLDEFTLFFKNMPYLYDLFVSTANETDRQTCQQALSGLAFLDRLTVTVVPNRGRDLAPFFCTFGPELQGYDYLAHVHSKKSLYSHGAADGWREYLLTQLFGSSEQVQKIFALLTGEQNIGFVYPQNTAILPHWANTWLSNRANGTAWCRKLGITPVPVGYFDFPAGSMFWARTGALQPLFDAHLKIEDFPEEAGQNDATLAHCLERLFVLTTRKTGLDAAILKDTDTPNWSRWRIDRYLAHQSQNIQTALHHPDTAIVVFDIFDTLLTRPLLEPEHLKNIIARRAGDKTGKHYLEFRAMAENQARQAAGRDVDLDSIYRKLAALSGLPSDDIAQLRAIEESIESAMVSPRPEAIALFQQALSLGKRVILASDMYLPQSLIEKMLRDRGINGWHAFYLSSATGLRKDSGDFYRQLLLDEKAAPHTVLVIGDNEHSDAQKPGDMKCQVMHLMRPVELARATPRFEPIIDYAFKPAIQDDLNTQLTLGCIVEANFRALFYPDFDPADLVPASPWAIGFTIAGPLILSFVQWLAKQAKVDAMQRLYFLSREGAILKTVYDLWVSNDTHAIASEYLVLSRRAVTVPMISNRDDIFNIARTHYARNPMPDFIFERYGVQLSDTDCDELSRRNIWPKEKTVSVEKQNIEHLKPLLQALENRILEQAAQERPALMAYLQHTGLHSDACTDSAIVDIGYAATTQDRLNQLLQQKIHGYYMMTLDRAKPVADTHQVITQGFYCHFAKPSATEPQIYRKSFTIEKLLSDDTAQIVRYHMDDNGATTPEYRPQTAEERQSATTRAEIRRGIMDFTHRTLSVRDHVLNDFEIPHTIAEMLFLTLIDHPSQSESDLLRTLVLDDYYYGHGLVR